tara:strand:+ start:534 stop:1592 length:1059 start_codon:yes stop_codon:yes gene_type:complete
MTSVSGVTLNGESCLTFSGTQLNVNSCFTAGASTNTLTGGNNSSILAGQINTITAPDSSIGSGCCNSITLACRSFIGTGHCNLIAPNLAQCLGNFIGGGTCNRIINCVSHNSISAGCCNSIREGTTHYNHIGAGILNDICKQTCYSAIAAGHTNKIVDCSRCSWIGAGSSNCICASACNSGIMGGYSNYIAGHDCTFIIGTAIHSTNSCVTYMNNGNVTTHLQVGGCTKMSNTAGRIDATNDVVAFSTSDKRLKENILPIKDALCKVIGVSGNTFNWKELTKEDTKTIHGNTGKDVGVIAQEIEAILPEAVTTRDSGYKAVNYEKLVPLLIEAVKDLTLKVEKLEAKIGWDS